MGACIKRLCPLALRSRSQTFRFFGNSAFLYQSNWNYHTILYSSILYSFFLQKGNCYTVLYARSLNSRWYSCLCTAWCTNFNQVSRPGKILKKLSFDVGNLWKFGQVSLSCFQLESLFMTKLLNKSGTYTCNSPAISHILRPSSLQITLQTCLNEIE